MEPGTSVRSVSASGVSWKTLLSVSSKTPTLASARRTRWSAGRVDAGGRREVVDSLRPVAQEVGDAERGGHVDEARDPDTPGRG